MTSVTSPPPRRSLPAPASGAARRRPLVLGLQLAIILGAIALAYWLNATSGNLVMPSPTAIWQQSVQLWSDGTMLHALGQSAVVLLTGFALAATCGVLAGTVLGGIPLLGRVFDPFVNAFNATPGAAFIPLIIVWFGLYTEAKIIVVWLGATFPILIATAAGIETADEDLVEMARSFGASRRVLFWQVMLPAGIPAILGGLRIGAAISVIGTVIAELYMAQSGLGGLLAEAGARFQMARYFAVVIVLMALGTLITLGLRVLEARVLRWRPARTGLA